jgi:hypothetical protein
MLVVYQDGSSSISGGARSYRKWRHRKSRDWKRPWPEPEVTEVCSTHPQPFPAFFSYCGSTKSTMVTRSVRRAPSWKGVHNILPSGAFWPEVTFWNVIRSDHRSCDPEEGGGSLGRDARMRNRKLRNISSSMAFSP